MEIFKLLSSYNYMLIFFKIAQSIYILLKFQKQILQIHIFKSIYIITNNF